MVFWYNLCAGEHDGEERVEVRVLQGDDPSNMVDPGEPCLRVWVSLFSWGLMKGPAAGGRWRCLEVGGGSKRPLLRLGEP